MPVWPAFVLRGGIGAVLLVAVGSGRLRRHQRLASVLAGVVALGVRPRALARCSRWSFGVGLPPPRGTVAVAAALDIPHPPSRLC